MKLLFRQKFLNEAAFGFTKICKSNYHLSAVLFGAFMKPEKQTDPEIVKRKLEKKKNNFLRDIEKIRMQGRKLRPVDDFRLPFEILKQIPQRTRQPKSLSDEESEKRYRIKRDFRRHSFSLFYEDCKRVTVAMRRQLKALNELKLESEQLYEAAVEPLQNLFQVYAGPKKTPPVEVYLAADGAYNDITKNWEKDDKGAVEFMTKQTKKLSAVDTEEGKLYKLAKQVGDVRFLKELESKKLIKIPLADLELKKK